MKTMSILARFTIYLNFSWVQMRMFHLLRDLSKHVVKINREQSDDDIWKTIEVFKEIQASEPLVHIYSTGNDESRVKNLMWTNGHIEQYQYYGEVLRFDTTYMTNLYDMPFGLFMGVINHFQSIIVGGVLVRDETIDTFKWVFAEFIWMMGVMLPWQFSLTMLVQWKLPSLLYCLIQHTGGVNGMF